MIRMAASGRITHFRLELIYEDVVFNDLSLSEIAKEKGISRQGVHDMIKRCDRILNGYEEKLGLVGKFLKTRELVEEINTLTCELIVTSASSGTASAIDILG